MNGPSGIVYYDSGALSNNARQRIHLPLEEVRVKVVIVDVSARVTLTQSYSNPSDASTGRCKYCFPVPASAAICAFSMTTSDGRTINGIVKDKDQAREEYQAALNAGRSAGMLEYVTDDIFTVSVGAIPAQATVETKIEYVISLANDDNTDEVRFQLPMVVGERYGPLPPELVSAHGHSSRTRIRLTAEIQTSGKIQNIRSPSHQDDITSVPYVTHTGRSSRRRFTVKFKSRSFLERDFILIIQASALDSSRCFAELDRGSNGTTIAMQLTIVPKFELPPIETQEYAFVVDRSGSMSGERISTAKRTLRTLLRMLPAEGTVFNIFSFGSSVDGLWPRSYKYDQSSLDTATTHVHSMGADYGGTEIRQALQYALGTISINMPTAVFVLTDGEANDIPGVISVVEKAVNNVSKQNPLRVFTLGIGDGVSSAMCEGIARAGNGACLFAVNTESILGKCARLFRAGRTPFLRNVRVDWGISDEDLSSATSSVNFLIPAPPTIKIRRLPATQQVPTTIHQIHAGTRTNVFVIFALKNDIMPKSITLHGELDDGSGRLELPFIPVEMVQLEGAKNGKPLIHTLAAWRLIQEHEEKRAPLPQPQAVGIATDDQIRKAVIIHLGQKYRLVSQYTSFVAIDDGQDDRHRRNRATSSHRQDARSIRNSRLPDLPTVDNSLSGWGWSILNLFASFFAHDTRGSSDQTIPGAWTDSPSSSPHATDDSDGAGDDGYESVETFSTLSSLEGSTEWSDWSRPATPEPQMSEEDARMQRSPSPSFELRRPAPGQHVQMDNAQPVQRPPPPVQPEVVELVNSQLYDGSFPLQALRGIVGEAVVNEASKRQLDNRAWATALSVAYIEKHMGSQKELMDDLLIKAKEYLHRRPDVDVKELIKLARRMI